MFEPDDAREMERAFKVLGDRMEEDIAADCSEVPCSECDDIGCPCDCHFRHEWTDIGLDEPEGLEATDGE